MGDGKKSDLIVFAAFIVIMILVGAVMLETGTAASSDWMASNRSPVGVVVASGTWTTTNQYGSTVTYSTVYTSTSWSSSTSSCVWPFCSVATTTSSTSSSSSSSSTTSTAGAPWIQLTFHGTYQITDANGNVVYTYTFSWAPIGGSGNGTHVKYDVTYDVQGQGVDWSTLTVNVNVAGSTWQPSVADPNTPERLNTVDSVDSIAGARTTSGHLGKLVPIDTLIGGKSVDKKRVLSPEIDVTGTATAKLLPGYSLAGGNTVGITTGPVVGISSMNWKEDKTNPPPPPPPPPYTAAISTARQREPVTTHNPPSGSKEPVIREGYVIEGKGVIHHYSLLGLNEPIAIFGAEVNNPFDDTTVIGLIVAVIVLATLIIVWKEHPR